MPAPQVRGAGQNALCERQDALYVDCLDGTEAPQDHAHQPSVSDSSLSTRDASGTSWLPDRTYTSRWKAEASAFNGREPDAARTDLNLAALDSFAGRFSLAPTAGVVLQASAGHLHEAEAGVGRQPRIDVNRATASATYHRDLGGGDLWATMVAYGVNWETDIVPGGFLQLTTHAVLLETSTTRRETHTWFGRMEVVGKPAHDLHAHEFITQVFTVGKVEAGYVRHVNLWKGLLPGVGASVSTSLLPPLLAPRYGAVVSHRDSRCSSTSVREGTRCRDRLNYGCVGAQSRHDVYWSFDGFGAVPQNNPRCRVGPARLDRRRSWRSEPVCAR
jgi:hypothetical protein